MPQFASRTRARHLPGQRRDLLHRGRVSRAAGGLVLRWSPLISQGDSPLADAYPQTNPHSRIGVRLVAAPATRSGAPSGREHDDAGSLPDARSAAHASTPAIASSNVARTWRT